MLIETLFFIFEHSWKGCPVVAIENFSFGIFSAGGLNQPPRSFRYMFLSKGCLELSELVWHLVFGCKLLSPEPSKTTLKNWTQPRWKLWPPGMGSLKGFPWNGPRGCLKRSLGDCDEKILNLKFACNHWAGQPSWEYSSCY